MLVPPQDGVHDGTFEQVSVWAAGQVPQPVAGEPFELVHV